MAERWTEDQLREVAERLFAQAVAQGFHAPFSLDVAYWGREYAERLLEALAGGRDGG